MRNKYWDAQPNKTMGKTTLANFPAKLFLLCMATGVLGVNLQVLPYQFKGLGIISIIIWAFDILLYFSILSCYAAKWILFPRTTSEHFDAEMELTMYLSTVAISWSTIIDMFAIVLGKRGHGWGVASVVLWYMDVAISLFCTFVPYWVAIRHEHQKVDNLPPTILYPATSILSCAAAGSVVIKYTSLEDSVTRVILILAYILLGFGSFAAFAMIVLYTSRLIQNRTPAPEKAMASFVPIAALSNAGYAAISLGRESGPSRYLFRVYAMGVGDTVGLILYGVGILGALMCLGFACFWILLSVFVVAVDIRQAPFTLNYWSSLYPIGIFALLCGQLAMDLNSSAFKVVNTIFTFVLLLLWLYCWGRTIPLFVSGKAFLKDADEKLHFEIGDSHDEESEGTQPTRSDRND